MDSMEEIYQNHAKTIYGFLLARLQDADIAEELTQETFYRAVKKIKSFRGECSVSTWLCGIAKNVWLEYLKRQNKKLDMERIPVQEAGDGAYLTKGTHKSAEDSYMAAWDNIRILKALHNLKDPVRETMYLRLIGNLTFRQIGEIMDRSENWARITFYRGKEIIMKEVEKDDM